MRVAVLVDSLVVLGVAAKGRSSSHRLNPVLRRLNAHVLDSGFYVFFGYVASHANPADAPSRCHSHKKKENQRQDALSDRKKAA